MNEPNQVKVEVDMSELSYEDVFLFDAETGEPYIIPSSEPLPFSFKSVPDAYGREERKAEAIKFIADKFNEMLDEGLRVEEVIDELEGK